MENLVLKNAIKDFKIIRLYLCGHMDDGTNKAVLQITDGDVIYRQEKDIYIEYQTDIFMTFMREPTFKQYTQNTRTKSVMNHMKQYIFTEISTADELEVIEYMHNRGLIQLRDVSKNLGTDFYTNVINKEFEIYIKANIDKFIMNISERQSVLKSALGFLVHKSHFKYLDGVIIKDKIKITVLGLDAEGYGILKFDRL